MDVQPPHPPRKHPQPPHTLILPHQQRLAEVLVAPIPIGGALALQARKLIYSQPCLDFEVLQAG
jgi:hypothetical protein